MMCLGVELNQCAVLLLVSLWKGPGLAATLQVMEEEVVVPLVRL